MPSPPLTTMCISMKTVLNPVTHTHEIVAISAVVNTKVEADGETIEDPRTCRSFTLVRQLGTSCGPNFPAVYPHDIQSEAKKVKVLFVPYPSSLINWRLHLALSLLFNPLTIRSTYVLVKEKMGFATMPNERALLDSFFMRLGMEDPDVLVSHNLFGFEFDVLIARAAFSKVANWSKIGRLRKSKPPKSITEKDFAAGRILSDTYKAAKEFLRETTYSLTHLAFSQLDIERKEVDPIDTPR